MNNSNQQTGTGDRLPCSLTCVWMISTGGISIGLPELSTISRIAVLDMKGRLVAAVEGSGG